MDFHLANYTDVLSDADEIGNSQPLSLGSTPESVSLDKEPSLIRSKQMENANFGQYNVNNSKTERPARRTGQHGEFRSVEEIDSKYRDVFTYPYFNLVQSRVIDEALYSDRSMVVCAPTGSGKTVIFEMAVVQLLMELDDMQYTGDFKIIYMAPVKALCTERLSEWYPKFTKLGLMCIEVTGDTNVDFSQLKPYRIIITTPEKWDMLTRRWRDHRALVEVIKLFLIDEVHILNDECRGPVLEAVVSRMKTIESSSQSAYRIEQVQKQYQTNLDTQKQNSTEPSLPVRIRFVAVSATVSNPEDVAAWLGTSDKPAVYYKFGDECRPVKLKRVVEGYPCSEGTSIFKFDIILNYKLWPIIQKYHDGKPTLIFCNTRKSVAMTAETISRELTISFTPEQKARLTAIACTIKNKKLQALVLSGVGCHHAGLLFEERLNIEEAFRNRDLPILITTTTLAMGVNLPAHLVIIKNTQQYVNGAYQEYSISTVLQMVGRAGRPQFDTEATAVIMTRLQDKPRYQALVGGDEPLQSYLHKRLAENLNSEAALGTVCDVAQCVQWVRSTFLNVRAAKDPKRYLSLPPNAQPALITKKIEELCVKAMNGLASSGLITMDEASCIESTEAGRLMSVFYLDLETMKHIMKINGTETLEKLLWIVCECHELADMHLRVDERRTLNTLNRNNAAATIRFPMKGKISTRQMKLNCIIQAVLGCLPIPDPSLNQEAMKVMRIADRVCKCLVAYVTRPDIISSQPQYYAAVLNALLLNKCIQAHLWENSPYVSKQLKGIGPTFSTLLATAGKVNFALLEEAHPRDLERIMNKGAPAGNVIRKQVTLLPKYQLTATPVDEKRISIKLLLLNQHQLADNRDHLTAGDTHRAYILVGDLQNYVLLFTSFKDKDLISVYDGSLTYEITRKHAFEHKILIHCISSDWVGIDVQCDYTFKNIEPPFLRGEIFNAVPTPDTPKNPCTKQTSMTDAYTQRKRKNNNIDFTESKEKKKRDTALVDKFKHLKKSFEITSKELRDDLDKSAQMSNMIVNEMMQPEKYNIPRTQNHPVANAAQNIEKGLTNLVAEKNIDVENPVNKQNTTPTVRDYDYPTIDLEDFDHENDFIVDDKIDSILHQIENEIHKSKDHISNPPKNINSLPAFCNKKIAQELQKKNTKTLPVQSAFFTRPMPKDFKHQSPSTASNMRLSNPNEKKKRKITKTNYSFIDTLEKSNDVENNVELTQRDSGFSETIKNQIEKFLQKTVHAEPEDINVKGILECTEQHNPDKIGETINNDDRLPLSLVLPSVYVSSVNHNESENAFREKASDIKSQLHISNNVKSIDNIVDNIMRDYDISTKESDDIVRKDHTVDRNTNMLCENLNDIDATYCDNYLDLKPFANSDKYHCNVENLENNVLEDDGNIKKNETRNDLLIQKPMQITENYVNTTDCDNFMNMKPFSNSDKDHCNDDNLENSVLEDDGYVKKDETRNDPLMQRSVQIIENNILVPVNKTSRIIETIIDNVDESKLNTESESIFTNKLTTTPQTKYVSSTSKQLSTLSQKNTTNMNVFNTTEKYSIGKDTISNREYVHRWRGPCDGESEKNGDINFEDYQASQEDAKKVNPDEHINRYTFSVTKVDVSTKKTSEHHIRLIRKLKLDLDVTEIVSTAKDCSKQETNKFESPNASNELYEIMDENKKEQVHAALTHPLKIENGDKNVTRDDVYKESYKSNAKKYDRHLINNLALASPNTGFQNTDISKIEAVKTMKETNITNKESINLPDKYESSSLNKESYKSNAKKYDGHLINNLALASPNTGFQNTDISKIEAVKTTKETKITNKESINLPEKYESSSLNKENQTMQRTQAEEIEHYKKYLREIAATKASRCVREDDNISKSNEKSHSINTEKTEVTPDKSNIVEENNQKSEECNDIKKILHKYRSILSKDNKLLNNNKLDKITVTHKKSQEVMQKTKKPYKISDIQNVHIPLPKTLIAVEATRNSRPANDVILTRRYEIEDGKESNLSKFTNSKNTTVEYIEHDLPDDIPECSSPIVDIPDIELPEEDYDLDQSMLNPKTLLEQCFFKNKNTVDEEIIPPPPCFCDTELSSPKRLQGDLVRDLSSPEYFETDFDDYTAKNHDKCIFDEDNHFEDYTAKDHDKSIFNEDNHAVLTPSVEIETWTLSRNDEMVTTDYFNQDAANTSFTVMRRNPPVIREPLTQFDIRPSSRRGKLCNFKFTPKKKLKL